MLDEDCLAALANTSDYGPPSVMTRDLLEQGGMSALIAKDAPGTRILSSVELQRSLQVTLAHRPPGDLWVFGYGSLIWNPAMRAVERRNAIIEGWHRSFCLSITALRATPDQPGLMLALDRGGSCEGIAYRIDETDIEHELKLLWRREMVCDFYQPQWVALEDKHGAPIGHAIAFTIDRGTPHYAGKLDMTSIVHRLALAKGALGSCRDYLFRTCAGLAESGCSDMNLDHLASLVQAASSSGCFTFRREQYSKRLPLGSDCTESREPELSLT